MSSVTPTVTPSVAPSSNRSREPIFDRLGVLPVTDQSGEHDPRSAYVETFWLPVLGPTTTMLIRRLAEGFDRSPDGYEVDCVELSRSIGLGSRLTSGSTFVKAVERAGVFGIATLDGPVLYVRTRLAGLSRHQQNRLSAPLRELHAQWHLPAETDDGERKTELVRATRLARALIELGESDHDIERQLRVWRFDASMVWHAMRWAHAGGDPA